VVQFEKLNHYQYQRLAIHMRIAGRRSSRNDELRTFAIVFCCSYL